LFFGAAVCYAALTLSDLVWVAGVIGEYLILVDLLLDMQGCCRYSSNTLRTRGMYFFGRGFNSEVHTGFAAIAAM
jgi:hypothetical protein